VETRTKKHKGREIMVSVEQINAFISVYETKGYASAAEVLGKGITTIR